MKKDVVIHTNESLFRIPASRRDSLLNCEPLPEGRVDLADDLWIGRLDSADAELILDSCEPRPYGANLPVRQFAQLYTFVRESSPGANYDWDLDRRLQVCIALSRLVHPTSVPLRYSASVIYNSGGKRGKIGQVYPGVDSGIATEAYVAEGSKRDWLTEPELIRLAGLLAKWEPGSLPDRVARAFWYHEYASRLESAAIRWTVVATGLEALIHTDRENSTKQFVRRTARLAAQLQIMNWDEERAGSAYDWRSSLSHGQGLGQLSSDKLQVYILMETVLRTALIQCLQDSNLANLFRDENSVRSHYPLE